MRVFECVCELFNFDFSGLGLVGRLDVPVGFSFAVGKMRQGK